LPPPTMNVSPIFGTARRGSMTGETQESRALPD